MEFTRTEMEGIHTAISESVLRSVQARYPRLQMQFAAHVSGPLDFELRISAQPGLVFDILLASADDTLYFGAAGFWMEYFPVDQAATVRKYENAVEGVLSGRYRIVEYRRGSHVAKARLECPREGRWHSLGNYWRGIPNPFAKYDARILQNTHLDGDL